MAYPLPSPRQAERRQRALTMQAEAKQRQRDLREWQQREKLCAVIVAAYRATRWIDECLESIEAQQPAQRWTYDLRVAVDACPETSAHLLARGVAHWWSPENVGPHLLRNTLMQQPADAFAVVDADDRISPDYLKRCLPKIRNAIAVAPRQTITEQGRSKGSLRKYGNGAAVFSAGAWERLGAFRPWRIVADGDAMRRAKALRIKVHTTPTARYYRRVHPGQLTSAPDTGWGTPERERLKAESMRLTKEGSIYVQPTVVALEWRDCAT